MGRVRVNRGVRQRLSGRRESSSISSTASGAIAIRTEVDDGYMSTTSSSCMSYSSSSRGHDGSIDDDTASLQPTGTTKLSRNYVYVDGGANLLLNGQRKKEDEDESRDDTTQTSFSGTACGDVDSVVGEHISLSEGKDNQYGGPAKFLTRVETAYPMFIAALSSGNIGEKFMSAINDDYSCSTATSQTQRTFQTNEESLSTNDEKTFVRFVEDYNALNNNKTKLASSPDLCTVVGCCGHTYDVDDRVETIPMVVNCEHDEETVEGDEDSIVFGRNYNVGIMDNIVTTYNKAKEPTPETVELKHLEHRDPKNLRVIVKLLKKEMKKMERLLHSWIKSLLVPSKGKDVHEGNDGAEVTVPVDNTVTENTDSNFDNRDTERKKGNNVSVDYPLIPYKIETTDSISDNASESPATDQQSTMPVKNDHAKDDVPANARTDSFSSRLSVTKSRSGASQSGNASLSRNELDKMGDSTTEVKEVMTDSGKPAYLVMRELVMRGSESSMASSWGNGVDKIEDNRTEVKEVMTDSGKPAYLVMRESDMPASIDSNGSHSGTNTESKSQLSKVPSDVNSVASTTQPVVRNDFFHKRAKSSSSSSFKRNRSITSFFMNRLNGSTANDPSLIDGAETGEIEIELERDLQQRMSNLMQSESSNGLDDVDDGNGPNDQQTLNTEMDIDPANARKLPPVDPHSMIRKRAWWSLKKKKTKKNIGRRLSAS